MNQSKVKEKKENTWLFKGEIGPRIVAIELVVGADLRRRGSGFTCAAS